MKINKYKGFDNWNKLYHIYKDKDMSDSKVREALREDFNNISKVMWATWINENQGIARDLTEMWMWTQVISELTGDVVKCYNSAVSYIQYASDRMNVNRWLRIRLLLNTDIQ